MYITGYDEAVAEANGFKIVTYYDGSWESVPVTEKAKALNVVGGVMHPTTEGARAARPRSRRRYTGRVAARGWMATTR